METPTHSPASNGGGAAPSISSLIAGAVGSEENEGATALDDLSADLAGDAAAVERERETPSQAITRRRHERGKKKRAHVRTRPLPDPVEKVDPDPEKEPADSGKAPKKAELQAMLEQAQRELADLRARQDTERVGELDNLVQMVAIMAYGRIAEERGPHWALSSADAAKIGAPTARALAPYAAQLNANIPWVSAALAIADVTWTRVRIDQGEVRKLQVVP